MTISLEDFIKKYQLDDFKKSLELNGSEKINLYNDLMKMVETTNKIFDKLINLGSLRAGLVLASLAKLAKFESVINKTDVKNCLNIDRREKLMHAFDYLEEQGYINVERKSSKFHIVNINEEDNPDFGLFREIVQKFWTSPEENKNKVRQWRDGK
ncbi:MAG: hypothetical protein JW891_11015 [Candidatus Lokiarchaeota archaeon]|nr:hypothetical protein [Candidatus Lokiarchaeota archaeon]